jgi:hypothetical protein
MRILEILKKSINSKKMWILRRCRGKAIIKSALKRQKSSGSIIKLHRNLLLKSADYRCK